MQLLGGDKHLQRTGFADEARETLRASPSRDQAQRRAAMAEDGVRVGDALGTCKR
jgi:hypothetical protein